MKTLLLLASIALAPQSYAAELCGRLGMEIIGPHCSPHQMCPRWRAQQFFLLDTSGTKTVVQTASFDVLTEFSALKGAEVCAVGSPSRDHAGAFDVTEIHAR